MDAVRLRVLFADGHILTKSQKSEGLNRSWLLLKPQHQTISDLSSYLAHFFDLHRSCPNGIVLSMDGFVLPPFESTCILQDKDVIRIKRKRRKLCDFVKVAEGANLIEEEKIVEKQHVISCVPLLTTEEFGKETGDYQSEPEEEQDTWLVDNPSSGNAVSKKRKASKKLQSPKKKKKRTLVPEDVDLQMNQNESCNNDGVHCGKSVDKKQKLFGDRNNDNFELSSGSAKRFGKLQENSAAFIHLPDTPDGTRKAPSRSARRQYARRRWLRELKAEKKVLDQMQSPEMDMPEDYIEHQGQNQNVEAGDEIAANDKIVPVVVRPGHIRFEPPGKDGDQTVQQSLASVDTFQWTGITSKKQGQKWGKQKFGSGRRDDYEASNKELSEVVTTDKMKPPIDPTDFDRLTPLNRLPMEGEVIAYRLLELSATWSPKLSSFRVGKTSWCDPKSKRILLTPVAEYPIIFHKQTNDDACAQEDNSPYREDGSLEISFMSLIDVRIVNHGNSVPAKAASGWVNKATISNEATSWTAGPSNNYMNAPTQADETNVWDKHVQAQIAKKAQVIHVNSGSIENSGTRSCLTRSLRSSAVGPAMALRRSRNNVQG